MSKILCFGDSNTWGYDPVTKERYPKQIRWTGLLQEKLADEDVNVIEEGLCGRTTIYEDRVRPGRRGIDSIEDIFNRNDTVDSVIFMLGTNDCKSYYKSSPKEIAEGIDSCLDIILKHVPARKVLLISPIHLGQNVWKDEYDPEFDKNSVEVSKGLKNEYMEVAKKRKVNFLAASDYVSPSPEDQEHLNVKGHKELADVIGRKIMNMESRKEYGTEKELKSVC